MPDASEQQPPLPLGDLPHPGPPDTDTVPGLCYIPDWLTRDARGTLLARIDAAPWSTQLKRRVQHYGHRYDYGRRTVIAGSRSPAPPIPAWARTQAARLVSEGAMADEADQVIVNEYRPGQGISAHVDCVPCFGPVVAALSLGSGCLMDFTHPDDGTKTSVRLDPGSLLIMTGPARFTWRHGIAARKSDPGPTGRVPRGRRVSVTFRTVLPDVPASSPAIGGPISRRPVITVRSADHGATRPFA